GVMRACEKTEVTQLALENLVDEIEAELQQRASREVASHEIGELVLKHLQALNEVAYVRFASVYRKFTGIRDFADALNHLQGSAGQFFDLGNLSTAVEADSFLAEDADREASTPSVSHS
ncbi:MAG TPA: ATP cone domain-containing protein, partial [Chroococcidiopsis sp.]